MKTLLTGSSGFIGGHFAKLITCDCAPDPYWDFKFHEERTCSEEQDNRGMRFRCFQNAPLGYETLIHLAAITDPQSKHEADMMRVNHDRAIKFFKEAIKYGVKRIVYASSASVYGDNTHQKETASVRPLTVYAKSKAMLEVSAAHLSATTGVPIIGLRFSNVYGPNEGHKGKSASVVYQLVQQMKNGQRPKLFKYGKQRRDWVSVFDVCRAIQLATTKGESGVYNVGSGVATSFNEVVRLINKLGGYDLQPEYIDNPYSGYQSYTRLDIRKAQKEIGYVPEVPLWNGIGEIIKSPV